VQRAEGFFQLTAGVFGVHLLHALAHEQTSERGGYLAASRSRNVGHDADPPRRLMPDRFWLAGKLDEAPGAHKLWSPQGELAVAKRPQSPAAWAPCSQAQHMYGCAVVARVAGVPTVAFGFTWKPPPRVGW